jgi:hypothetical protein
VDAGVRVGDAPSDSEGVGEGVAEGVGSATPCTNSGPAYTVPVLETLSHTEFGKMPAAVPVRTLVKARTP